MKINPKHADAWFNKGATLYDAEKYIDAVKCYSKSLENNPDFVFSEDVLHCYYRAIYLKGAKEIVTGYVKKFSEDSSVEIERLCDLLEKKYDIIVSKDGLEKLLTLIKDRANEEENEGDYQYFKKKILSENPKIEADYVDALLEQYAGNYDNKLEFLKNLLSENNIKSDTSELKELIQQRITIKELESFEEQLLSGNKLALLKKKIQKWKQEGYNVEELEKKIKSFEK